jgi:hypothetical protein
MMETPKDKVISYIVVSMVAAVVLFVVVTVLMGIFFVSGSVASFGIH